MIRDDNVQYVPVRVAATEDEYSTRGADQGGAAEGGGKPANPLLVVHSLLRGRYLIAGILAVVGGVSGCLIGWLANQPVYQSVGVIQISPVIPNVVRDKEGIIPMFDAYLQSQVALIQSDKVVGQSMDTPEWQSLGRRMSPVEVAEFTSNITVDHPRGSQLIQIAYTDRDPQASRLAVKLVMDSYNKTYGDKASAAGLERSTALDNRIASKTSDIHNLEAQMARIAGEVGSPNVDKIVEGKIQERQDIAQKLNTVRLQLATATAVRKTPEGAPLDGVAPPATTRSSFSIESMAARDPLVKEYLHQRVALETNLIVLKNRFGAKHNRVIETLGQLDEINQRIDQLAKALAENDANGSPTLSTPKGDIKAVDAETLRIQEKVLKEQYDAADKVIHDLGTKVLAMQNLRRDKDAAQADLDEAKRRKEDLDLSASITGRVVNVGIPDVPVKPLKDKRLAFAGAGGFFGVALGVGSLLLIGFSNRRLRHIDDAHSGLCRRVPLLGILPQLPNDMSDPEQSRVAVHAVHQIRAMLQIAGGPSVSHKTFAVTSPAAGDGKTSLTLALGLSFAACGARTLLIDFDLVGAGLTRRMSRMIRPKLGRILRRQRLINSEQIRTGLNAATEHGCKFGQALVGMKLVTKNQVTEALGVQKESLVGLLDVLAGEPLDECVTGAGVNGLFVLPVGSAKARHVSRLSPIAARKILDEAKKEFDIVLIDTGPALGSLEASIVVPEVDGVILAVSRGEQRPLAVRSMDHLISIGARMAGVVFNRAHSYDMLSSRFSSSTSARLLSRAGGDSSEVHEDLGARLGPVGSAVVNAAADMTTTPTPTKTSASQV